MNSSTSNFRVLLVALLGTSVIAVIAIVAASEWMLRTQVDPQDHFSRHIELFHNTQHKHAIFGDSHVARGFIGSEDVVNLAYLSESIPRTWDKVKQYCQKDKCKHTILLQADPNQFAAYRFNAKERDFDTYYVRNETLQWQLNDPYYNPRLVRYWETFVFKGLVQQTEFTAHGSILSTEALGPAPTCMDKLVVI